jgi:hypothetical protein
LVAHIAYSVYQEIGPISDWKEDSEMAWTQWTRKNSLPVVEIQSCGQSGHERTLCLWWKYKVVDTVGTKELSACGGNTNGVDTVARHNSLPVVDIQSCGHSGTTELSACGGNTNGVDRVGTTKLSACGGNTNGVDTLGTTKLSACGGNTNGVDTVGTTKLSACGGNTNGVDTVGTTELSACGGNTQIMQRIYRKSHIIHIQELCSMF